MTAPNAELGWRTLDAINAHRKAFDMRDWWDSAGDERVTLSDLLGEKCGTTACFAGWAIALSGYDIGGGITLDGEPVAYSYARFAEQLLGLTGEQSDALFFVDNDGIGEAVAEIFGPRPAVTA